MEDFIFSIPGNFPETMTVECSIGLGAKGLETLLKLPTAMLLKAVSQGAG